MGIENLTRVQLEELLESIINEVYDIDINLACKYRINIDDLNYLNETALNN